MNEVNLIVATDVALICTALIAWVLGWLFTEKLTPVFRFKPFNCRPCLTFWLALGMGCAVVNYAAPFYPFPQTFIIAQLLTVALLVALITFLIVKLNISIYE